MIDLKLTYTNKVLKLMTNIFYIIPKYVSGCN